MKNIACFDVGGTFIKYALINSEGEIILKDKYPSPRENCKVNIPKTMVEKVKEMQESYEIHGVGISTAGQVDSEKGEIVFATENLPGYTGAKLAEYINKELGLKAFVENDVNAAALGEMWKGAAQGKKSFVCITLGTGIGGAIVADGKLFKGISGSAGEVGHMIVNERGEKCNCGMEGCYERYASTSALIRQYEAACKEEGIEYSDINGEKIMELVHKGDVLANKVYEEFLYHVVTGLVSITHILDPGTIVIGGGISAQGESFFQAINKRFKERAMKSYSDHTEIIQAVLKNDAGIYGAAYFALNSL